MKRALVERDQQNQQNTYYGNCESIRGSRQDQGTRKSMSMVQQAILSHNAGGITTAEANAQRVSLSSTPYTSCLFLRNQPLQI